MRFRFYCSVDKVTFGLFWFRLLIDYIYVCFPRPFGLTCMVITGVHLDCVVFIVIIIIISSSSSSSCSN